ncbi:tRNA dihydrouridine synthase DusB [Anaerovorax odorimutans]|uniref:tRNA dihydrouridine synthase DusB n=1 Tax=Anaerovorax odorimutans TaxID=109327 RepID=UPI0004280D2D|nr:tRNA dihydrouridine synthase DusB [Anaerovorax odorimutans]
MKNKLQIGNIKIESPFLLAPLAGVTDAPFRRICKQQGAALVYSEMVSGKGLYYNDKNTERLLKIYEDEKPVAYQIFGSEPEIMAYTAKTLAKKDNCLLDINMGCPVPKVVKNGEGSALLKSIDKVYEIVKAVVLNAEKPVTAKIRIGWDEKSINAVETAKAIEAAGASAVCVHGRTREQFYNGKADWSVISNVKKAIKIPVIGNGDVFNGQNALDMMKETNCDFVMIARGAMGNPWIFKEALALWNGDEISKEPTLEEKLNIINKHFDYLLKEKGEYAAVREMRKHIGWYLKGVHGAAEIRRKVNNINDADLLMKTINCVR